jgi:protein-L-isoaspartate(D-aspartate) O-methyltransferase
MIRDDELKIVRRAYAKQILHAARARDPRLEEALANLRREDFLPSGPWQLMRFPGGYQPTPNNDSVYLYQDAPVAILPEKRLNNGQPSFLTFLISIGGLQAGGHAIHFGTGTGYYTAVMGTLAESRGLRLNLSWLPARQPISRDSLRFEWLKATVQQCRLSLPTSFT